MSNFDPDPPSRDPLDRLWVTREETIARGLVGGGGAIFVILVVIGLIYLFIAPSSPSWRPSPGSSR